MERKQQVLGVIPARLNSTRLHRKMLVDICGKPMIIRTWERVKEAEILDAVVVATDSDEIAKVVESVGGDIVRTTDNPKTGTDRVAEAARAFEAFTPDIVVNIQGDEPLMPTNAITMTASLLVEDEAAVMSTVARPYPKDTDLVEPGQVKVVLNKNSEALYFSRSVIPYARESFSNYYNHLGIYAYRFDFLQKYVHFEQTPLELSESLEQLRALENGYSIKVGIGDFDRVEVNEPHELEAARAMMEKFLENKQKVGR